MMLEPNQVGSKENATSTKKGAKRAGEEQLILDPAQDNALTLVDGSAKNRAELERTVALAVTKTVRKLMRDHGVPLRHPTAAG